MRGRSWWRGTAGSVAVVTLLTLASGVVAAQSPMPSPPVRADAPADPASDLWSVARAGDGAVLLRLDGITAVQVASTPLPGGCDWRSTLAPTERGIWVSGGVAATPRLDKTSSMSLSSVCFGWLPFDGSGLTISRLWVPADERARVVRTSQQDGTLWAVIANRRGRDRELWSVSPGASPARIVDGIGDGVAAGDWLWLVIEDRPFRLDPVTGRMQRLRLGCGSSGCGIRDLRVDTGGDAVIYQGEHDWGPGIRGQLLDLDRGWSFGDVTAGQREGILRPVSPLLLTQTSAWGVLDGDLVTARMRLADDGAFDRMRVVGRCPDAATPAACRYVVLGSAPTGIWAAPTIDGVIRTVERWDPVSIERLDQVPVDPFRVPAR